MGVTPPGGEQRRFTFCRLAQADGVLEVTLHVEGDSLVWAGPPHAELGEVFAAVGSAPETRVVLLTGCGDHFIKMKPPRSAVIGPAAWRDAAAKGERLILNHLSIPVPVIGAVNGPVAVHSELAVLCDIVLAAESAEFADLAHVPRGVVPGDGMALAYPAATGSNRARYFLLTGQRLSAAMAMEAGIVAEVLPDGELLSRARALARQLARLPAATLHYTRQALTSQLRAATVASLRESLAMEGLAGQEYRPAADDPPRSA
jgi:enoyl-CoA hydratase/carnithine racemase